VNGHTVNYDYNRPEEIQAIPVLGSLDFALADFPYRDTWIKEIPVFETDQQNQGFLFSEHLQKLPKCAVKLI
jgi:hypothetical protein